MLVGNASSPEICSSIHDLQFHHIESRRMGGAKNPTVHAHANKAWLRTTCHRDITENRWQFTRTEEVPRVAGKEAGKVVARRLSRQGLDGPRHLHSSNLMESQLEEMLEGLVHLKDGELGGLFQRVRSFANGTWKVQAAIL